MTCCAQSPASEPPKRRRAAIASICTEAVIDASPDEVWSALRDWGALHERLVPGFAADTQLEGDDRIVTFVNGVVAYERFVDLDDEARRLVWSIEGEPYTHHNASAQVFTEADGRSRFVWIADLLPHELAERIRPLMERGTAIAKQTLENRAAATDAVQPT
jgi:hypothetical protein